MVDPRGPTASRQTGPFRRVEARCRDPPDARLARILTWDRPAAVQCALGAVHGVHPPGWPHLLHHLAVLQRGVHSLLRRAGKRRRPALAPTVGTQPHRADSGLRDAHHQHLVGRAGWDAGAAAVNDARILVRYPGEPMGSALLRCSAVATQLRPGRPVWLLQWVLHSLSERGDPRLACPRVMLDRVHRRSDLRDGVHIGDRALSVGGPGAAHLPDHSASSGVDRSRHPAVAQSLSLDRLRGRGVHRLAQRPPLPLPHRALPLHRSHPRRLLRQ